MNLAPHHNPISLRILSLAEKWEDFSSIPQARICIWQIEADEQQMIDHFFTNEISTSKATQDLFFAFDIPFEHSLQYNLALVADLQEQLVAYRENFPESDVNITWLPTAFDEKDSSFSFMTRNFHAFVESLEEFDEKFAIYLAPGKLSSYAAWENWLIQFAKEPIPERLRFMLIDSCDDSWFSQAIEQNPEKIIPIEADLEMAAAMQEVAATVDMSQPGAQFQMLFLKISEAVNKGKMDKAQRLSKRALSIAQQEGWSHLQVAVYFQLGAGWINKRDWDAALREYETGRRIAENYYQANAEEGAPLLVQALFAKASVYIMKDKFPLSLTYYLKAKTIAEEAKDYYNAMEAARMAGYLSEKSKDLEHAWQHNQEALDFGAKIEEDLRQQSTLPYVGQALLNLNKRSGDYEQEQRIRAQMYELVGADWESKIV